MEFINFKETESIIKNKNVIYEYNLKNKDINFCLCKINGRYPDKGFALNEKCEELAFIVKGKGQVCIEDKLYKLNKNSVVLINKGEKFFWKGKFIIARPCSPAWNIEQYKTIYN